MLIRLFQQTTTGGMAEFHTLAEFQTLLGLSSRRKSRPG
jgi:hypothetical protein